MPTLEAIIVVYVKLNLMLVLAWVLWKACNSSEFLYRASLSSQSKLRLARIILQSSIIFPILVTVLFMLTPLSLPFGRLDFKFESALMEGGSRYFLPAFIGIALALGFAYKTARLVEEFVQLKKVIRSSNCLKKIGSVQLLYSEYIEVPFATGFLKNLYIVIPEDLLLSRSSLAIVLDHESQHVRSGDLYWLLLMRIVAILCFWNPAVLMWQNALRNLQEYACDEVVTGKAQVSKQAYAECLFAVASRATFKRYNLALPMGVWSRSISETDSELRERIVAIYSSRPQKDSNLRFGIVVAVVMLIGSILMFGSGELGTQLAGQSPPGSASVFKPDPFFGMFR